MGPKLRRAQETKTTFEKVTVCVGLVGSAGDGEVGAEYRGMKTDVFT